MKTELVKLWFEDNKIFILIYKLIAAAGDVHYFEGVAGVNDPLWMTKFAVPLYSS
jgi:hypothetical protein